jgi:hypothetical protein
MAGLLDPHADDLLEGYADLPFLGKPVALGGLAELLFTILGSPTTPPSEPLSIRRVVARRRSSGQNRIP